MNACGQSQIRAWKERRTALLWLAAAAAALVAGVWSGCSIEKHYATLSFFFDGVPDPNAPGGLEAIAARSRTLIVHQPYKEDQCEECHGSEYRPIMSGSQICLACHAEKQDEYEWMHGPVAVGACLFCHAPHSSTYPALLRRQPEQLCFQCHEQMTLDAQQVPAHADDGRSCLECHSGHGGAGAFFLHAERVEPTPPGDGAALEPGSEP